MDGEFSETLRGFFIISSRNTQKKSDFSEVEMSVIGDEDGNESSSSDRTCVDDSANGGDSITTELTLFDDEGVTEGEVDVFEVGATVVNKNSDVETLASDGVSFDGDNEISVVEIGISGDENNTGGVEIATCGEMIVVPGEFAVIATVSCVETDGNATE